MDFTFSSEADDAAALTADILQRRVTPERQRQVEAAGGRHDHELWHDLSRAGLTSLPVPEQLGGAGLGLVECCRVLVEVGRVVAPVALATHLACAVAVAELGSDAQRDAWLLAPGDPLLAAAVAEPLSHSPAVPGVSAHPDGDTWRLDGEKVLVRAATHASSLLVTATSSEGAGIFRVDPLEDGVDVTAQRTSDQDVAGQVVLTGARAELVGTLDGADVRRLHALLTVTTCAELLGVSEGALHLTASYAGAREQFGRPIGTFQGVRHRLADGHIDLSAQRLTLWQAAWRVAEGLPATAEVATAKLWAADAAHRTAHTTVHVHGGVGIDLDGEAHRFFTAAKRFEHALGGATEQALVIGRTLAE